MGQHGKFRIEVGLTDRTKKTYSTLSLAVVGRKLIKLAGKEA